MIEQMVVVPGSLGLELEGELLRVSLGVRSRSERGNLASSEYGDLNRQTGTT